MDGRDWVENNIRPLTVCTRKTQINFSSTTNINAEDIAPLFRCVRCKATPIKPPVYFCRHGHLNCYKCYCKMNRGCYYCKEPLLGRNLALEEVMKGLPIGTFNALSDASLSLRESRSETNLERTLQDPSLLDKLEQARQEAERKAKTLTTEQLPIGEPKVGRHNDTRNTHHNPSKTKNRVTSNQQMEASNSSSSSLESLVKTSARPVTCPFPCGRKVTPSSLLPHFEFHHPHVMLVKVHKNYEVPFKVAYNDFRNTDEDECRCINFFLVKLDDKFKEEYVCQRVGNSAELLKVTRSSQQMVRSGSFLALMSIGRIPNPLANDSWFLAVWATALYDFAPMTYTIRACNPDGTRSYSFTGTPTSLHSDQRPRAVYDRGECLLVPPALLLNFHEEATTLELTINFQSDLPFPFDIPASTYHWTPDTPFTKELAF